jgi:uncharacterized protein YjbI with pentapeptide repeats
MNAASPTTTQRFAVSQPIALMTGDASGAVLDNLSLAGAEATGLNASGATSGKAPGTVGANVFDARLTDADFRGAFLRGVSLNHSRFDGAKFSGATWLNVDAETASFRGAQLGGLNGSGSKVDFADFTGANLDGSPFQKSALEWATLCHTTLPGGFPPGAGDRDCRAQTDPGPTAANNPFVVIDNASFRRLLGHPSVEIRATITWNAPGIESYGMSIGDVRVVAIDGSTGLPTTIDSRSLDLSPTTTTTTYNHTIRVRPDHVDEDRKLLKALNRGNRVVLTATQHPPLPRLPAKTNRSYVTVHTMQSGPGRGRVGMRDCSNLALTAQPPRPPPPAPQGYDFCDLPGAVLTQAKLSGSMRKADLTGAELGDAGLSGMLFDGAAIGGVVARGANFNSVHMMGAFAPRLTMPGPGSEIDKAFMLGARLDDADFAGARLLQPHFAAASLRGANFSHAIFDAVDLGFARLPKAKLDHVKTEGLPSTLFLANLTGATLAGSDWDGDEIGERPWQWATLCDTTMPAGVIVSGDRDCPR